MLLAEYAQLFSMIDRELTPVVSYKPSDLFARYLKDEKTGNVILGGFDGWYPYYDFNKSYGFSEEYNDKKYLITNSTKVYLDKREELQHRIRYIPLISLTSAATTVETSNIILDKENWGLSIYGGFWMKNTEFMKNIIEVKKTFPYDLYLPLADLGDSFANNTRYYYNKTYEDVNIYLEEKKFVYNHVFIYNSPEYENYILVYPNFRIDPYVHDSYIYCASKVSPNTYGTFIDILNLGNVDILLDDEYYTTAEVSFEKVMEMTRKFYNWSAELLNDYENDPFKTCKNSNEIYEHLLGGNLK